MATTNRSTTTFHLTTEHLGEATAQDLDAVISVLRAEGWQVAKGIGPSWPHEERDEFEAAIDRALVLAYGGYYADRSPTGVLIGTYARRGEEPAGAVLHGTRAEAIREAAARWEGQ